MEHIVKADLPEPVDGKWETFAEDVWLGMTLKPFIESWLRWKPVKCMGAALPHYHKYVITMHLSVGESTYGNKTEYLPSWMYDAHNKVMATING